MRRIVRKWFWVWDWEKEEKWLNEMSAKGLQLCGVGLCKYVFDEGLPGEYYYRTEMLKTHPYSAESSQYIRFLEETGIEFIGSVFRWVYLRKKADDSGFDIHSDLDSRIKHLNRILIFIGAIGGMNLTIGAINVIPMLLSGHENIQPFGFLNLALGLLILTGWIRVYFKARKLKKEKILHE